MPPAVAAEIARRDDAAAAVSSLSWVVERAPGNAPLVAQLRVALHAGEAEAIALASELRGDVAVALDDRRARRLARSIDLEGIGTAGVIAAAKGAGLLPEARPALDAARAAGLYLGDAIYADLLARVGEGPNP